MTKRTSWADFQKGVYKYYAAHVDKPVSFEEYLECLKNYHSRKDKYIVYFGYKGDKVVYVGTTIQPPHSRWYYHSIHGKDFRFEEKFRYDNERDMLNKEFELIKQLHPKYNKITNRIQNLNVELTAEELEARKGNPEWCQCCLKRRVNKGYKYCYFCSTHL